MTVQSVINAAGPTTLVTTAETVVAVLPANQIAPSGGGGLLLTGYVNVTAGTGATAVTVRVRQGSTTGGALVGTADTDTLAAGSSESVPFAQLFPPGTPPPPGNQFCVTVAQVGATGNGTVNNATLFLDSVSLGG